VIPFLVTAVMCALLGPVLLAVGYLAGDMLLFLLGLLGTALGVGGVGFWQRQRRASSEKAG
jgi:hypothetical protein